MLNSMGEINKYMHGRDLSYRPKGKRGSFLEGPFGLCIIGKGGCCSERGVRAKFNDFFEKGPFGLLKGRSQARSQGAHFLRNPRLPKKKGK